MDNTDKRIKISIMIITYNRKKELLRALDSCINNKIDDMEIVVLDNHSDENSEEEVKQYVMNRGVRIKYLYSDKNLGIAEGRNVAFRMCEGEYIFCLDDDAIIETKNAFNIAYERMKSNKAVAAAVEIYEPANDRYLTGYRYKKNDMIYSLSYIGAAHILEKQFFTGRDLYPSNLKFGSEEYYVAYRLRKNNKPMLYLSDVRVLHLPSQIARVHGSDRDLSIIVNNYVVRKMCYPIAVIPALTLMFIVRLIKHGFLNYKKIKFIKGLVNERYQREYIDRMTMQQWTKMIADTNLGQVI